MDGLWAVLHHGASTLGSGSVARQAARIHPSQKSPSHSIASPAPSGLSPAYFIPDPKTAKWLEPAPGRVHACHQGSQETSRLTQH